MSNIPCSYNKLLSKHIVFIVTYNLKAAFKFTQKSICSHFHYLKHTGRLGIDCIGNHNQRDQTPRSCHMFLQSHDHLVHPPH